MAYTNPIIFVHGIQGSWLKNQYPVDYQDEIYWTAVTIKRFKDIHLSAIDSSVDRDIDRFIFPHQAVPLAYESFVNELREEVTEHTYVFTYDWRKDNRYSAKKLKEFVGIVLKKAEIHAKQYNEKHPKDKIAIPKKVSLIGHSMGGLVIKWYVTQELKKSERDQVIDRIISIATPYYGSLKAVEAILPGARNFFGFEAQKAMRQASRTLPGVYQLLPSWDKAVVDSKTGEHVDVFNAKNWQTNLTSCLKDDYGKEYFQRMLDDARGFTDIVKQDYDNDLLNRFYCVYGTKSETLKKVVVDRSKGNKFIFEFSSSKKDKELKDENGDGTVHIMSSKVKFLKGHSLNDKKKLTDLVGGQHAMMTKHGNVQDFVVNIFDPNELRKSFDSIK